MKAIARFMDATLGRYLRHLVFMLVRPYLGLFYNISCSNRHLLQDIPGGLILASHVSRLDGALVAAILYSTKRVRPCAHYTEYYNWLQWLPLALVGTVPMSSPREWPAEKRAAQKESALGDMRRIIGEGFFVLLFPAGQVKKQPREVILPYLSGAYDTLKAVPDCPVALVHIEGLSAFDQPFYDLFYTFIGRKKGRRHINVRIELVEDLDTDQPLEDFNADLERRFNEANQWPLRPGVDRDQPAPE